MSPYEKCLFWWTEVNLFGLEFEERFTRVPFLRIKSEKLLIWACSRASWSTWSFCLTSAGPSRRDARWTAGTTAPTGTSTRCRSATTLRPPTPRADWATAWMRSISTLYVLVTAASRMRGLIGEHPLGPLGGI